MKQAAEFRRCLIDLDVDGIRHLSAATAPHLQLPKTAETLIALHLARTHSEAVPLRMRAYSHRWLLDNGYPSFLPDDLKPKAERLYPKVVEAVGIAVKSQYPERARRIRLAMSDAVEDIYADKLHPDPALVKARMMEARRWQARRE